MVRIWLPLKYCAGICKYNISSLLFIGCCFVMPVSQEGAADEIRATNSTTATQEAFMRENLPRILKGSWDNANDLDLLEQLFTLYPESDAASLVISRLFQAYFPMGGMEMVRGRRGEENARWVLPRRGTNILEYRLKKAANAPVRRARQLILLMWYIQSCHHWRHNYNCVPQEVLTKIQDLFLALQQDSSESISPLIDVATITFRITSGESRKALEEVQQYQKVYHSKPQLYWFRLLEADVYIFWVPGVSSSKLPNDDAAFFSLLLDNIAYRLAVEKAFAPGVYGLRYTAMATALGRIVYQGPNRALYLLDQMERDYPDVAGQYRKNLISWRLLCYRTLNRYKEALPYYERELELHPNSELLRLTIEDLKSRIKMEDEVSSPSQSGIPK